MLIKATLKIILKVIDVSTASTRVKRNAAWPNYHFGT